jgi:hypothetical protein
MTTDRDGGYGGSSIGRELGDDDAPDLARSRVVPAIDPTIVTACMREATASNAVRALHARRSTTP